MSDTRLPAKIEEYLLEIAADHSQRSVRREWLAFGASADMRDTFLAALSAPDIQVHAAICDDDPEEICVRASGTGPFGVPWNDVAIILLAPYWADQEMEAQALADDIVEHWSDIRAILGDIHLAA